MSGSETPQTTGESVSLGVSSVPPSPPRAQSSKKKRDLRVPKVLTEPVQQLYGFAITAGFVEQDQPFPALELIPRELKISGKIRYPRRELKSDDVIRYLNDCIVGVEAKMSDGDYDIIDQGKSINTTAPPRITFKDNIEQYTAFINLMSLKRDVIWTVSTVETFFVRSPLVARALKESHSDMVQHLRNWFDPNLRHRSPEFTVKYLEYKERVRKANEVLHDLVQRKNAAAAAVTSLISERDSALRKLDPGWRGRAVLLEDALAQMGLTNPESEPPEPEVPDPVF